jgi:protein-disulfide isomerase
MRLVCLALAATISLTAAGCTRAAEDSGFGDKVRAYLLAHPEVIADAIQKLQDKQEAEAQAATAQAEAKAKAALQHDPSVRQALEHDPRDFVANPAGKITVTEFYDYRCPHCINAAPAVLKIIQDHPDVRFVFKEMPIFGATSEYAARAAIAVKTAGGDYLGMYRSMMSTRGLDADSVDQIAAAHGVNPVKAEAGPNKAAADAQIADIHKLAKELGVDGTPAFIIGDTLVPGEDMDAVRIAIHDAQAAGRAG